MSDPLTPAAQAAINAYTGPVQVIPAGASNWLYPVWDGSKLVQQIGAKEARRRFGQRHWAKRRRKGTA
jgi:hypothetical protein